MLKTFCHGFFPFISLLPGICVSTAASKLSRGTSISTATNLLQLTQRGGSITLFKNCMPTATSKSPCGNFNNLPVNSLKLKWQELSKHLHAYSEWQAIKCSIHQQSHKFIRADTDRILYYISTNTDRFSLFIFLGFTYC